VWDSWVVRVVGGLEEVDKVCRGMLAGLRGVEEGGILGSDWALERSDPSPRVSKEVEEEEEKSVGSEIGAVE